MASARVYLDHNATSPIRPPALAHAARALETGGNPSSVHGEGRKARALIEAARDDVARLVNGSGKRVIFTASATEALNLALQDRLPNTADARDWRLFTQATEHAAVLSGHGFPAERLTLLPITADGALTIEALERALAAHPNERPLLALQLANNETGVIQPVAEAAALIHARGGLVVCDAVQAAGKIPVDMAALGADLLVLSAHKIGGPAGAGALIRGSDAIAVDAMVLGGGQERGQRAGTENLSGIAGFGAAAQAAMTDLTTEALRLVALRNRLEAGLKVLDPDAAIFGVGAPRLPNTTAFALRGMAAETALISLDLAGFAVSSGSACSSGKVKASHVLAAMGVDNDMQKGMIRVSLGWTNVEADVDRFLEALAALRANSAHAGKVLAA